MPGSRRKSFCPALRIATGTVALVGMMGSGKSEVGRRLAPLLGRRWRFADLDDDVVRAAGGRGIPEIFARNGEAAFRAMELAALEARLEAARRESAGQVLALGGGCYAQPAARAALEAFGARTIWLDVPAATLVGRLRATDISLRPLLARPDWPRRLDRLLAEREPFYRLAGVRLRVARTESPAGVARRARAVCAYPTHFGARDLRLGT